jgi:tetratricopeptide (TPR) repeat protein
MSLDIDRNRRIGALLKMGDSVMGQGSPECLSHYEEALRLATEGGDLLRSGEALRAIGRAYGQVAALRDYAKAEDYSRRAVQAAEDLGPFGRDLAARAKLTLANALVDQVQRRAPGDATGRLREAATHYQGAATSDAADASTRAAARNGLGMVHGITQDYAAAAEQYVAASTEFESLRNWSALAASQANAALAFYNAHRFQDAQHLAREGLATLARVSRPDPRVHDILDQVFTGASRLLAG